MISDEELEQLRYKGESTDLDFKQAQYSFTGASDHEKSELLKDVMAMANAYRSGPGYILIGFKDLAPHPAEVVGISAHDHIDDATLQQFVRSKIEPGLDFQYEERLFGGKHIAIIAIPKQARPFVPKQDLGKLKKNIALVRRGSSTDEASISELTKMILADAGTSRSARLDLHIDTEENTPLPDKLTRRFFKFGKLPDYEESNWIDMGDGLRMPMPSVRFVNRNFYRESAIYYATMNRLVLVRLSLLNRSDFALEQVKIELTCTTPPEESAKFLRSDDLPEKPRSGDAFYMGGSLRGVVQQLRERLSIDDRTSNPVCNVHLGTLRSGETGRAETDIAFLPSGPGEYSLKVRILAKEITAPIVESHTLVIDGPVKNLGAEDLPGLR